MPFEDDPQELSSEHRRAAAVLARSREMLQGTWFPKSYSADEEEKLLQRQTACKEFVFGPLRTLDAQERTIHPIKPIPRLPYLETWIDGLVREPDVINPKVRRMIKTLSAEGYLLWRIIERPGTYVAMVHASMEDGVRHVEEDIKDVMWGCLPPWLKDQFNVEPAKGQLRLSHRMVGGKWQLWDSWIVPYPTGARQLRSFGHGIVFWDEFSTHPKAESASKGIVPTLFGRTHDRGQMIRMGTVNPDTASGRYFKKLYEYENYRRARMIARFGAEIAEVA